mgnify:CR=1 FL=1
MPVSESQKKATYKYKCKVYDFFQITLTKGKREFYKVLAEEKNESLNTFVIEAIENRIIKEFTAKEIENAIAVAKQREKEKEKQKNSTS